MKDNHFIFIILIILIFSGAAFAKDINFEITIDRNKISLGESAQLNLIFYGTQDIPEPIIPETEAFAIEYLGPSTRVSVLNGKVSSSITHIYKFTPLEPGRCHIGPLSFVYKGDTYISNELFVDVVKGPVPQYSQPDETVMDAAEVPKERVFVVIQTTKKQAYMNEIMPLSIRLYVNRLAIRDIQYPQVEHEGFSLGQYSQPKQYREIVGGNPYDVIEFNAPLFATRVGEFELGPAIIKCNLMIKKESGRRPPSIFDDFFGDDTFDDFFGRYDLRPMELKSNTVDMIIYALPAEDKPDNFSGAIGDFQFDATIKPQKVRVGDPITLTMEITGDGNLNTVQCPSVEAEGFKVYEPQATINSSGKVFEQLLMPMSEDIKEIPAINFSFFNTRTSNYETAAKGPFPIEVARGQDQEKLQIIETAPKAGAFEAPREEALGRDIIYIKESPGDLKQKDSYLYKNKLFLLFNIFLLFIVMAAFVAHGYVERLKTDIRYARGISAHRIARKGVHDLKKFLSQGKPGEFYDALFRTAQEYLGDKFHLASHGITFNLINEILKNKHIKQEIIDKLEYIFNDCDMARFSSSNILKEDMHKAFKNLQEVITELEKIKA